MSKSSLPGLDYTFNPYIGCMHGCIYCYVQDVLRRCVSTQGWGEYIHVKEGILDRLRAELRRSRHGVIGVSTVTDPYQPIEKELEMTRQALSIIGSAGFKASVQTKSSLVSRDLDVIKAHKFELGITVSSLGDAFCRKFEPRASPPGERAMVLEEASSMGIKTWIFYGPIIPGHNDSLREMEAIASLAGRTNSMILFDRLNLKPLLRSRLQGVLTIEELQVIAKADFSGIFTQFSSMCRAKGVVAKYAF
jgi:DNA repair photolyase